MAREGTMEKGSVSSWNLYPQQAPGGGSKLHTFHRTFVMWSFPWRQRYTVPWFGNGATAVVRRLEEALREVSDGTKNEACGRLPKKLGKFKRISGAIGYMGLVRIFTYMWLEFMVHVGKHSIHGSYGIMFLL